MSNKKQTAVEYLNQFLSKHCNPSVCDIEWSDFNIAINEAKAMEKEQIENAFENGIDAVNIQNLEQYYKETFGDTK
jgi:hypothetical protein